MSDYDNYNVVSIPFPNKGMNQNVSSELLPKTQTHILENIIPLPIGEGNLRYGCKLQHQTKELDEIIEIFSYVRPDGVKQLVLYGTKWKKLENSQYVKTELIGSYLVNDELSLTMSERIDALENSKKLKIVYEHSSTQSTIEVNIDSFELIEKNAHYVLVFGFNDAEIPADSKIVSIAYAFINEQSEESWVVLDSSKYAKETSAPSYLAGSKMFISTVGDIPYLKDTPKLKVIYNHNGTKEKSVIVKSVHTTKQNEYTTLTLEYDFHFENTLTPPSGSEIVSIYYQVGCLRVYDVESKQVVLNQATFLEHAGMKDIDDLHAACVPRSVIYNNRLLICNGIDNVRVWDGVEMTVLSDFVNDKDTTFSKIEDKKIKVENVQDVNHFQKNKRVKIKTSDRVLSGPYYIDHIKLTSEPKETTGAKI